MIWLMKGVVTRDEKRHVNFVDKGSKGRRVMMHLEFCDRYGYPEAIKELFRTVLRPIDPQKVRSVLLFGSSAQGEMGFSLNGNDLVVYSDYDLMVIPVGRIDARYRSELRNYYRSLAQKYPDRYPRIDFIYRDVKRLKRRHKNRPDMQYQYKHSGTTIYGEDLRSLIPDVKAGDLRLQFKIEMLLGMYWHTMLLFPKDILLHNVIPEEKLKRYEYAGAKFFLELVKWILMMEGVLLPTYRARIDYLQRTFSHMKASDHFSFAADILEDCYNAKTRVLFRGSPVALFTKVIEPYLATPGYLSDCIGAPMGGGEILFSDMQGLPTPDDSLRRRMYDLYLATSRLRPFSLREWYRWISQKKYRLMLDFLYAMFVSLHALLVEDQTRAGDALERARGFLKRLVFDTHAIQPPEDNPVQNWLLLRRMAVDFRYAYFPSLRVRRETLDL